MKYILGVDGGGTKTLIRIATVSGYKVAEVISGSTSHKSVGIKKAISNLNSGIFRAIKKIKSSEDIHFVSSCFGFAGNNTEEDKKIYTIIVFNDELKGYLDRRKTVICNDTVIGLEAGSNSKNKIIIIAGSGSNCLGVNDEGKQVKASGWDYLLSDEGSGYQTGLKALKAVMKAYDGRGEETLLSRTIPEKLNLKSVLDLNKWAYDEPFSKSRISELARTVCETAQMGDRVSIDILSEVAEEAVLAVTTVAGKLGFGSKDFDLGTVGSLFKCKKYFRKPVTSKLKKKFSEISILPLVAKPVEGAVKIAIERLRDF